MDAQEAARKFKEAEALYAQGKYEEALEVLDSLDKTFPNTKNIMYPLALCYAGLGRTLEAADLCDRLISQFSDGRAQSLRAQLKTEAPAEDMGLDLNMDILGDLGAPVKKKPPKPPEPPSRMPLYIAIGSAVAVVLLVAILVSTGALSSLIAKLKPETVESALEKIAAASNKVTSCTGRFEGNGNLKQPMPIKINLLGNLEYANAAGKEMYKIDATIGIEGPMTMSQTMMMVSDGDTAYMDVNAMGQRTVLKMDPKTMGNAGMDPTKLLEQIKKFGTVSLQKDEVVNNKPAYVFLVTPSPTAAPPAAGMPEIGNIQVAVLKDTGMPVRLDVKDKSGAQLASASLKDVIVNAPASPETFKYTVPDGVKVMDMADVQKMMPIPGMPGMQ